MATETPKKPLMALGKIPSVDLLKEHLGLNTAPVNVKNAFRDITVQWRKTNLGSNSLPATDLTDWNSPVVQRDLYTLAENFLADKDNAEHFWSPTRPWKYESTLQYPDDKERYGPTEVSQVTSGLPIHSSAIADLQQNHRTSSAIVLQAKQSFPSQLKIRCMGTQRP